jgi:Leucine-rich repeat (LRR) protein
MQDTAPKPPVPAKARRRWVRFSLRTMLIGTTALCIWLGLVCNRANRQKRAVAMIKSAGGMVGYDDQNNHPGVFASQPFPPHGLGWLCDLVGDDYFGTVGSVSMVTAKGSGGDAVEVLGDLPHLSEINLEWITIPDAIMSRLTGLPLRYLAIVRCKVSSVGWESLGRLIQLRTLNLGGPSVDDVALSHLKSLANLTELSIYQSQITDAGLRSLNALSRLDSLALADNALITYDGIEELRRAMPNVQISSRAIGP